MIKRRRSTAKLLAVYFSCAALCVLLITLLGALFDRWIDDSSLITEDDNLRFQRHVYDELIETYQSACEDHFALTASNNCSKMVSERISFAGWHQLEFNERQVEEDYTDLSRTLLVIYFNDPHYVSAAKAYALYRRHFGAVWFCGPQSVHYDFWPLKTSTNKFVYLPNDDESNVRFFNFPAPIGDNGERAYMCFDVVMEFMANSGDAEKFDGVVMAADDVMLNYWTWKGAGKTLDKSWVQLVGWPKQRQGNTVWSAVTGGLCPNYWQKNNECMTYGIWFYARTYQPQMAAFHDELERLANKPGERQRYWQEARQSLIEATFGPRRNLFGGGDVYYLAKKHWSLVRPFFQLCGKHRVWLELCTGSAFAAVIPVDEVLLFDMSGHDWDHRFRHQPIVETYDTRFEFLHPFKMSQVFKDRHADIKPLNLSTLPVISSNTNKHLLNDTSMTCVYCYLLQISTFYADLPRRQRRLQASKKPIIKTRRENDEVGDFQLRGDPNCQNAVCNTTSIWLSAVQAVRISQETSFNKLNCLYSRPYGDGDGANVTYGKGPLRVCFDHPYRPLPASCLVYSFGVYYDNWSFEDALSTYGCEVHSFVSVNSTNGTAVHYRRPSGVFVYSLGDAHRSSLTNVARTLGHYGSTLVDIVKMDVEGAEWQILAESIDDGFLVKQVRQLIVEWHFWTIYDYGDYLTQKKVKGFVNTHRKLNKLMKLSGLENRDHPSGFLPVENYVNDKITIF